MLKQTRKKLVVIGGGTGSFTLLQALKNGPYEITSLVNMIDDGGSTGVLRDELGVLPPGDIRQCLVALSDAPVELRELFNYRFPKSTFEGHSFGNLFLSAVEKMSDSFDEAIRIAGDVLRIRGKVIPITLDNCRLIMHQNGKKYTGEHLISKQTISPEAEFSVTPPAHAHKDAVEAIAKANLIVIAPGNLYRSIIPNFLVDGIPEAIKKSRAKVVYVSNLVNKPKETAGFSVDDHVKAIEKYLGQGLIRYVLYNTDEPSPELLKRYTSEGEIPVTYDAKAFKQAPYRAIAGSFLSHAKTKRSKNDTLLQRSFIRHDAQAVARAVQKLI